MHTDSSRAFRVPMFILAAVAAVALLAGIVAASGVKSLAPEQVRVDILGRQAIASLGDTATLCAVVTFSDGTYRLGASALRLASIAPDTIAVVEVEDAIQERCAPLLRSFGIVRRLPTTPMAWSAVSKRPRPAPSPVT